MGQFGEALRKERESRGIALETISDRTKVVTRYLTALEDDNFAALPGGILSKGIVRGYARTVGLDETAWVERFVEATKERDSADHDADWVEFARNVGSTRARNHVRSEIRMRWAGVSLLLLVVAFFGWFVWHYVSGRVLADEIQRHPVTSAAVATPGNPDSQ